MISDSWNGRDLRGWGVFALIHLIYHLLPTAAGEGAREILSRSVQECNEMWQMKWDTKLFAVPTDWRLCGNKLFPMAPVWKLSPVSPQTLAPNGLIGT